MEDIWNFGQGSWLVGIHPSPLVYIPPALKAKICPTLHDSHPPVLMRFVENCVQQAWQKPKKQTCGEEKQIPCCLISTSVLWAGNLLFFFFLQDHQGPETCSVTQTKHPLKSTGAFGQAETVGISKYGPWEHQPRHSWEASRSLNCLLGIKSFSPARQKSHRTTAAITQVRKLSNQSNEQHPGKQQHTVHIVPAAGEQG